MPGCFWTARTQTPYLIRPQGVIDFTTMYGTGVKDTGPESLFLVPNATWQSVVDELEVCSDEDRFACAHLTLQRNIMIVQFVMHSSFSIQGDLTSIHSSMHLAMSKTLNSWRNVACENCDITPEEMGVNTKFSVCGVCKKNLGAFVYYCSKACQKDGWPDHKQNCGKVLSDPSDPTSSDPNLNFFDSLTDDDINALGFGTEHPENPHLPALQRQVALLRADRGSEYFLFDENDRPVPVVLVGKLIRCAFRCLRSEVIFTAQPTGIGVLAAHLIVVVRTGAGWTSTVSRDGIVEQFCREYGDVRKEVERDELPDEPGETVLEGMAKNIASLESLSATMTGGSSSSNSHRS